MDTEEEIKILKEKIRLLEEFKQSLTDNGSIPLDVGNALKTRILGDVGIVIISAKAASSENQGVNEAGAGVYSVLKTPDAFLQVTITGNVYYIPVYT